MSSKFKIGDVIKHLKTQGYYRIIGYGTIEKTMEEAVIYKSIEDNRVWIRPMEEMHDGRFEYAMFTLYER